LRVFFSAGEASGDRYAAAIARELPPCSLEGIGGPCLRSAGARIVADSSDWGAVSISQSAKVVPRVLRGFFEAKAALASGEPGLFVPVDFGFVNIKLARYAKRHGWRVLYFIPPGSWRRDRQGANLPEVADEIVTPFSWSAEILSRMGARAHWFGHPLRQLVGGVPSGKRQGIAVLPGSRRHELDLHLPLAAEALGEEPRRIEFALAPNFDRQAVEARWGVLAPLRQDAFTVGDTYGVLKRAEAAVVCSGTATLEAALCRCPMVVVYRLSALMAFEAALLKPKVQFASLPNILLNRPAVPELLHKDATPGKLRDQLKLLTADSAARQGQLQAFDELEFLLGGDRAISETARLAARMMGILK